MIEEIKRIIADYYYFVESDLHLDTDITVEDAVRGVIVDLENLLAQYGPSKEQT